MPRRQAARARSSRPGRLESSCVLNRREGPRTSWPFPAVFSWAGLTRPPGGTRPLALISHLAAAPAVTGLDWARSAWLLGLVGAPRHTDPRTGRLRPPG